MVHILTEEIFMKLSRTLLSTVFGLGVVSAAHAALPPYVTIPPVVNGQPNPSYGGTGCPTGSARAVVSPDRTSFTMIFDNYIAQAGSGRPMIDRKNCQILVNLDVPQGWTYSIARMDYRGFYSLGAGASGTQQATYYFQGMTQQASLRTNFVGPTQGNYLFSDTLGLNALVWAPCGARVGVNINTSLLAQVNNPSTYAYLTTDSADGSVKTTFALQWQKCGTTTAEAGADQENTAI